MKRTSSGSGGSRADDRRRPLRSWAAWPIGSSRDGASFERIHAQAVRRRSRHGAIINIGRTCWQVGSPCTRRLLRFAYRSSGAVDHDLRDGRTRPATSRGLPARGAWTLPVLCVTQGAA